MWWQRCGNILVRFVSGVGNPNQPLKKSELARCTYAMHIITPITKSLRDPSSHTQSHTKLSQGHQNTSILVPRFNRIPTSAKNWFLQHLPHQMLVSGAPDVQIQTLQSFKKVTWKPARTKNMYFDPRSPKSYQNGVPKSKQNRKNTKPGPQDLFSNAPTYPWIVPWSPRVQNGGRRHSR